MSKVNLGAVAQALVKAGRPGKVPEAARVEREAVQTVDKGPLPSWEQPATGVLSTSKAKPPQDLIRVCVRCGEDFKVLPRGDSLPTTCSACSPARGSQRSRREPPPA